MARIVQQATVKIEALITLDEGELRALDALAGYGDDAFIQHFYDKLGKAYMQAHEGSLRQFLKTIRGVAGEILSRADDARDVFNGAKFATKVKP